MSNKKLIPKDNVLFFEINQNKNLAPKVKNFLISNWYSTIMVIHQEIIDMAKLEGFIAVNNNEIVGLMTYKIYEDHIEIISLNSKFKGIGIGSHLIDLLIKKAKQLNFKYINTFTTNDNINAIKFYQINGFKFKKLYNDVIKESRKIKPEIPLVGESGIGIFDEIEFEMEIL
jgi:ribosomal protein S18 acetylase RimI-like enzyme